MDMNLSTIGVSNILPIQPAQTGCARGSGKTGRFDRFDGENTRISSKNEHFHVKKHHKASKTEESLNPEDIRQSDNYSHGHKVTRKDYQDGDFENTFRNRLKAHHADGDSGEKDSINQQQITAFGEKAGSDQQINDSQNNITENLEQILSAQNENSTQQNDSVIQQAVLQNTDTSQNQTQQVLENTGLNNQEDASQQETVITQAAAEQTTTDQQVIPETDNQAVIQQTESKAQQGGIQQPAVEAKDNSQDTSAVNEIVEKTGADEQAEATDQPKQNADVETLEIKTSGQDSIEQNQLKLTDDSDKDVINKTQQQIAEMRQQSEDETEKDIRIKNDSQKAQQETEGQLSKDAKESQGLTQNLDKAETFTVKDGTIKTQSDSVSVQTSRDASADIGAGRTETVLNTGRAENTSPNINARDNAASIREQIFESVRSSVQQGGSQVTVRLNPPELGEVSMTFRQRANEITGLLEATNPQTRAEIRHAIPDIIRSLENSGINVKRLDVTLSDSPRQSSQQHLSRDNTSADMWEQFNSRGFGDNQGNHSSYESYVRPSYTAQAGESNAVASSTISGDYSQSSDASLNVLL